MTFVVLSTCRHVTHPGNWLRRRHPCHTGFPTRQPPRPRPPRHVLQRRHGEISSRGHKGWETRTRDRGGQRPVFQGHFRGRPVGFVGFQLPSSDRLHAQRLLAMSSFACHCIGEMHEREQSRANARPERPEFVSIIRLPSNPARSVSMTGISVQLRVLPLVARTAPRPKRPFPGDC